VQLPLVLFLLLIVGLVIKFNAPAEKKAAAESEKCPMLTTTDGSNISVSKCVLEDKRSPTEKIAAVRDGMVAESKYNKRIKDAARDEAYVKGRGKLEGHKERSKDLDLELAKDSKIEEQIRAETLIANIRAEKEFRHNELKLKLREERTNYNVAEAAFRETVLKDDQRALRFGAALHELRKEVGRVSGRVEVSTADRTALDERKGAVISELKAILESLGHPDFKPLVDAVARQRGYGAKELREAIGNAFRAQKCERTAPRCWVEFVGAANPGSFPFKEGFDQIEIAFQEFRFHDAIALVDTLAGLVVERPHLDTPAARVKKAARHLPTFCVEIGKQGYLAVDLAELGSRGYAPGVSTVGDCVWAWQTRAGHGWSLYCTRQGDRWGFNQPAGLFVSPTEAAPSGKRHLPDRVHPAHPLSTYQAILAGCNRALAELSNDDGDIPGLARVKR
jgi:hypothetical protein